MIEDFQSASETKGKASMTLPLLPTFFVRTHLLETGLRVRNGHVNVREESEGGGIPLQWERRKQVSCTKACTNL